MKLSTTHLFGVFAALALCTTTACVVQPADPGGEDAGTSGPTGCEENRDCASDELCISGACEPAECQTDRQCRITEICDNGRCIVDNSCTSDRDCDVGFLCQASECVRDTRQRCSQHADCPDTGQICDIMTGEAEGFCLHHTDVECVDDSECSFAGGQADQANRPIRYSCEDGVCKADEKDGCTVSADCLSGKDCVAMNNGSRCLTPCTVNQDCGPADKCEPNLNGHCWYNLCGNPNDLSPGFADMPPNGALGGGCQADAPDAPSLPFCESDAECDEGERCNTELEECEKFCAAPADCGGGDNPWLTCRTYEAADDVACRTPVDAVEAVMGQCAVQADACQADADCAGDITCGGYVAPVDAVEEVMGACDDGDANACMADADCAVDIACVGYVAAVAAVEEVQGQCQIAPGAACAADADCDAGVECVGYVAGVDAVTACDDGAACVSDVCVTSCTTDADCSEQSRCTGEADGSAFCEAVTGICSHNQSDGHCLEVNAGTDEAGNPEWVGLCFEGGHLAEGAVCNPAEESLTSRTAERANDAEQCGGGLICAGGNADGDTTCSRTCAVGGHGLVTCKDDEICLGQAYNFGVCLVEEDTCELGFQEDSCGDNSRCGFFGWEMARSFCMAAEPEAERKAAGEACEATAECGDDAVCVGQPSSCRVICRPGAENSAQCPSGTTCQTLASLSGGEIESDLGLCWQ
ncbi:MAG: hypothetical protein VX405_11725 [Myxococcota bacterium]|nr:hypothetical protein [Myxococcota bacterium]